MFITEMMLPVWFILRPSCQVRYFLHVASLFQEVPDANWFCPSCRCGLCGLRCSSEDELFTEVCYQCSRQCASLLKSF